MANESAERPPEPEPRPAGDAGAAPTEAPASNIPPAGGGGGGDAPPPRARLTRSRSNQVVAGVAGGLGEYFEVDPTLVRVAIVVLTIITGGLFALVYVAAIIIMPRSDGQLSPIVERAGTVGREGSSAVAIVFGLILIAVGVTTLVQATELPNLRWDAVLAVVLGLIGLAIVFESRRGPNGGLIAVGLILTAVLAVSTALPSARWDSGFGNRSVHPTSIASLDREYDHAFGSMTVDLRDVPFPDGETRVRIGIAFGDLTVRVPSEVAVRVIGDTVFGSSSVLGRQHDGIAADLEEETDGYAGAPRRLEIELSNAFGSVTVRQ